MQGITYYLEAISNVILRSQNPTKWHYSILFGGLVSIGTIGLFVIFIYGSKIVNIWIALVLAIALYLLWIVFLGWIADKFLMKGYI